MLLKSIFTNYDNVVFVGGTSISKCFDIIKRFFEDIDLVSTMETRKGNQKHTEAIAKYLQVIWDFGDVEIRYSSETVDFKPIVFRYSSEYLGELNPSVRVELISFINSFPIEIKSISSMLNSVMNEEEINEYNMDPFEVRVQSPKRTFIEKILIQKEIHLDNLNEKKESESSKDRARDFYDIHKIWCYYKNAININKSELAQMVEARSNNRRNRTSISIDMLNIHSLLSIFNSHNIENQLKIDESKLSIRDLNIEDIKSSLQEIDIFLESINKNI